MPLLPYGNSAELAAVISARRADMSVIATLEQGKLPGRIRTGFRAVPTSHSDVIQGDVEGDIITDATYIYRLLSVSGALVWDRRALSVAW